MFTFHLKIVLEHGDRLIDVLTKREALKPKHNGQTITKQNEMKKLLLLLTFIIFTSSFSVLSVYAGKHPSAAKKINLEEDSTHKPDTVAVGMYITSIHDIDYRQKQYAISFWLWFTYKNPGIDFYKYLEIPDSKSYTVTYNEVDTSIPGRSATVLKLQCIMKDSWNIDNFPFNRQDLKFTIENAQSDINDLVFVKDDRGKNYDKHALSGFGNDSLKGWDIDPDSFKIAIGTQQYETSFDDTTNGATVYSSYNVKIGIKRQATGLFWKIFLGMYVSFLIALACFFIHPDSIDSRFGLSVGALFAVVGNKYIIESSLPESSTFTLVDTLHGLTLFYILIVVASSGLVLYLLKKDKIKQADRVDKIAAWVSTLLYVVLNIYFIAKATSG